MPHDDDHMYDIVRTHAQAHGLTERLQDAWCRHLNAEPGSLVIHVQARGHVTDPSRTGYVLGVADMKPFYHIEDGPGRAPTAEVSAYVAEPTAQSGATRVAQALQSHFPSAVTWGRPIAQSTTDTASPHEEGKPYVTFFRSGGDLLSALSHAFPPKAPDPGPEPEPKMLVAAVALDPKGGPSQTVSYDYVPPKSK
jgi:hypothetical protein